MMKYAQTLVKLTAAVLFAQGSKGHVMRGKLVNDIHNHGHDDDHNHKHNHGHGHSHTHIHAEDDPPTLNSKFDPNEKFTILGKEWKNNQEFIDSGARCGTHHSIEEQNLMDESLKIYRAKVKPSIAQTGSVTIDTYVHIITSRSGEGDITDKMVEDQITVMNDAFGGRPKQFGDSCGNSVPQSGAQTDFSFQLIKTTRTENEGWFNAGPGSSAERQMKEGLREGDCSTLNMYFNGGGGLLGWATFPNGCEYNTAMDGVVNVYSSVPGSDSSPYDAGDTATHEVGHWLGLYHTFQGFMCSDGDGLDETPAERSSASGCPEGRNTCRRKDGDDPIYNFMDYSYDCCMSEFAEGQDTRMKDFWTMYRGLDSKQILESLGESGPSIEMQ
mmetsp:Transcript_45908/g.55245  ORF Transcript_45908/g.55245 Transcript_45908/m.55245 type:complete len:385 (-) Transcript_45908:93-1247(-)